MGGGPPAGAAHTGARCPAIDARPVSMETRQSHCEVGCAGRCLTRSGRGNKTKVSFRSMFLPGSSRRRPAGWHRLWGSALILPEKETLATRSLSLSAAASGGVTAAAGLSAVIRSERPQHARLTPAVPCSPTPAPARPAPWAAGRGREWTAVDLTRLIRRSEKWRLRPRHRSLFR